MITKTSETHLLNAIKAALQVNSKVAGAIISDNWMGLPTCNLRGAVVTVLPDSRQLEVHAPGNGDFDGYHVPVATLRITESALARWRRLSLEEAYSLPDGVTLSRDCKGLDGKVVSARANNEDGIIVEILDFDTGKTREMAMLADINDATGLLAYARENIDQAARLIFEEQPLSERKRKAGGLSILDMIILGANRIDETGEEPFMDFDEVFGPMPEFA